MSQQHIIDALREMSMVLAVDVVYGHDTDMEMVTLFKILFESPQAREFREMIGATQEPQL